MAATNYGVYVSTGTNNQEKPRRFATNAIIPSNESLAGDSAPGPSNIAEVSAETEAAVAEILAREAGDGKEQRMVKPVTASDISTERLSSEEKQQPDVAHAAETSKAVEDGPAVKRVRRKSKPQVSKWLLPHQGWQLADKLPAVQDMLKDIELEYLQRRETMKEPDGSLSLLGRTQRALENLANHMQDLRRVNATEMPSQLGIVLAAFQTMREWSNQDQGKNKLRDKVLEFNRKVEEILPLKTQIDLREKVHKQQRYLLIRSQKSNKPSPPDETKSPRRSSDRQR